MCHFKSIFLTLVGAEHFNALMSKKPAVSSKLRWLSQTERFLKIFDTFRHLYFTSWVLTATIRYADHKQPPIIRLLQLFHISRFLQPRIGGIPVDVSLEKFTTLELGFYFSLALNFLVCKMLLIGKINKSPSILQKRHLLIYKEVP